MALGYIPFVRNCYNNVRNDPPTNQLIQTYPALQNYFVYFENTWLNANATFPPALWNVHNRPMDFRTNSHVESFSHKWSNAVGVRHPSLWTFIRVLKDVQAEHEVKVAGMWNGVPPPQRRLKWRRLEQRIIDLKNQYQNGARNLDEYR